MAPNGVQYAAAGFVGLQSVILLAFYLYSRRSTPRGTDSPGFRAFSAVYLLAVTVSAVGPLGAILSLGRLDPYATPLGPVAPLSVVNAGLGALVLGYVLLGIAFVSPWFAERFAGSANR